MFEVSLIICVLLIISLVEDNKRRRNLLSHINNVTREKPPEKKEKFPERKEMIQEWERIRNR